MPGIENPERIAFIVNGIEQVIGLSTGQAEQGINTVLAYGFDNCFGTSHLAH